MKFNKKFLSILCFGIIFGAGIFITATTAKASIDPSTYSPSSGYTQINNNYAYNRFRWSNTQAFQDDPLSSYEHETILYNTWFANPTYFWFSDMPYAYWDTRFLDSSDLDNFAIGTTKASDLQTNRDYYTYYDLYSLFPYPLTTSQGQVNAQKGHRAFDWCHAYTWCVLSSDATNKLATFTAPAIFNW